MVTMSSFGKFHRGSNTELFREITTIHASLLHSRIAVRIPLGQSKSIHSRLIRRRRIAWVHVEERKVEHVEVTRDPPGLELRMTGRNPTEIFVPY